MAAATASGADWGFPDDLPGSWSQEDVDAQLHSESETAHSQASTPRPTPTAKPAADTASSTDSKQESKQEPKQESKQEPKHESKQESKPKRHYPSRTCRICLEIVSPTFHPLDPESPAAMLPESMRPIPRVTYESPPGDGGRLLRPCHCKGSQKYVHEECLSAWRRQDPLQKRNYWQCPTCRYKYRLERLRWGAWVSSTASQIALTLAIFVGAMFALGFVADPIINLYLDPVSTIATAGGPTGSLIYDDEPATWSEHFVKGLASLGLLGFAKFLLTLSPWYWFNMRSSNVVNRTGGMGGTGRDRLQGLSWIAVVVGVVTFLWAVWKMVRAWSRRTLEKAGERVMDVPAREGDDEDEED